MRAGQATHCSRRQETATRAGVQQLTGCRLVGLVTGLDLQKPPQDRPLQPLPLQGPPPWPQQPCASRAQTCVFLTYSHSVFSFPLDVYLDPGKECALSCPLAASEAVSTSCFSCLRASSLGAVRGIHGERSPALTSNLRTPRCQELWSKAHSQFHRESRQGCPRPHGNAAGASDAD